jgi:chromosome segregation ATPase
MDDRALAFLHELEKADETVAALLTELDELAAEAERVHMRAVELEAFLIRIPAERERVHAALVEADTSVEERRTALASAESELENAEHTRDEERIAAARRGAVRARDALRSAERRLASLEQESKRLEAGVQAAERETTDLEAQTRRLAEALRTRPGLAEQVGAEPTAGLAGIADWASGARATLFVARGRVAAEREAVIRQANELGALVLGEPLTASSAALVARRVERHSS